MIFPLAKLQSDYIVPFLLLIYLFQKSPYDINYVEFYINFVQNGIFWTETETEWTILTELI